MRKNTLIFILINTFLFISFTNIINAAKPSGSSPVANDDSATMNVPDQSYVDISVLSNDTYVGTPSITITTQPRDGSASVQGTQIRYTPSAEFMGPTSLKYQITDTNGTSGRATVEITVNGPDLPSASDDSASIDRTTQDSIIVYPLSNDSPSSGLTITDTGRPSNGTAAITGGGTTVTYTPDSTYVDGTDSFSYTVEDIYGRSASATINVTVTGPPAPSTSGDSATLDRSTQSNVVISPLSNDTPSSGLTITAVSRPADGSASITGGGTTVTYTPDASFFDGTDSITYTVEDAFGRTATGTITVTVVAPVAPSASNDSVSLNRLTQNEVVIFPLSNDTPSSGLSITSATSPVNGSASVSRDGTTITYIPESTFFNGTDTFLYTVEDGLNRTSTASITVSVSGPEVPSATNDSVTLDRSTQTSVVISALSNDTPSTGLTITSVSRPSDGSATITDSGTTITYNVDESFYDGTDSITYTVEDAFGRSSTATVTITVIAPETPSATADSVTLDRLTQSEVVISPLSNDTPSTGLSILSATAPANGTSAVARDGTSITYTPDASFYNGTDTFSYTIEDGLGRTSSAYITVTVSTPEAPTATDDSATLDLSTQSSVVVSPLSNDTPSTGLTLSDVSRPANGSAVISDNIVTYTPDVAFTEGVDTFTYTVEDALGRSSTGNITVTVTQPAAPVLTEDAVTMTVPAEASTSISVLENDTGFDLSISSITQPANGSAVIRDHNTTVTYTPNADFVGTDSFNYTVEDGLGRTETGTVTITVNGPAEPVAEDDTAVMTLPGEQNVVISVLTNDTPSGAVINEIVIQPTNGSVVISSKNDQITYTPNVDFTGTDTFTYNIKDTYNRVSNNATVTITVNGAPVANDDSATLTRPTETSVDIAVLDNDTPEGDVEVNTIATQPANGTVEIVVNNSQIRYTPNEDFASGIDTFTYTVCLKRDTTQVSEAGTVTVTVTGPETPVATADTITMTKSVQSSIEVSVLDNDTPEESTLTINSIVSQPNNGTVAVNDTNTLITYTPNVDFTGTDYFSYDIKDEYDRVSDAATVTINVNDGPVASDDSVSMIRPEQTSIQISVLDNDTPADDIEVNTVVSGPSNGTAAVMANKTGITYTPNEAFLFGTDTFTYTICLKSNPSVISSAATVTITATGEAPVATDDSVSTYQDISMTISPLTNDTGSGISLQSVSSPTVQGGTAVKSGDSIAYTPPSGFIGTDTFSYTIIDSSEQTSTGTITVAVYESGGGDEAITKAIIEGTDEEAYSVYADGGSSLIMTSSEATNDDYLPAIEFLQFEQIFDRYAQSSLNTTEEKEHFQATGDLFDRLHELRQQMEDGDTSQATIDEFNSKMTELLTYISP